MELMRRGSNRVRFVLEKLESRNLPSFLAPVDYALPSVAYSGPEIADFNNDGRRDVAIPANSGGLAIRLGDGTGALGAQTAYASNGSVKALDVGDMNGDGRLDVVTANTTSAVNLFLGNGDGTFEKFGLWTLSSLPNSDVAVGDLNNDLKLDVAVSQLSNGLNRVAVLFGNGDGTLQAPAFYPVGVWAQGVQIGDLTGDGWNDLTVDNRNGLSVSVLRNRGDGTFLPKQDIAVGDFPNGHELADVNRDTHIDIVVANGGNKISTFLGNGDGTFQAEQVWLTGGVIPSTPVVADFNRDRKPDIATAHAYANYNPNVVSVLLGNGDGSFQASLDYSMPPSYGLAAGDLNNDRYPDIVATSWKSPLIRVFVNDAQWASPLPISRAENPPRPKFACESVDSESHGHISSNAAVTQWSSKPNGVLESIPRRLASVRMLVMFGDFMMLADDAQTAETASHR
jgi:hypothetical protein